MRLKYGGMNAQSKKTKYWYVYNKKCVKDEEFM